MADNIDTKDLDALSGAVYFAVGRGTEGGSASYRLSVAGVRYADWGDVEEVAYDSGYTFGAIQIDFGQRGTWPVGSIAERSLSPGEDTYVSAVIEQASTYALQNRLPFTSDLEKLRSDLLTHGNGKRGRESILFIDEDTRDGINAWASSGEGKHWIHKNMDLPQVRGATELAMNILDRHGANVTEATRFQSICILAKAANQAPAHLGRLERVLKDGGDYNDLLAEANAIKANPRYSYFDGPRAAEVAERYVAVYDDPARRDALDRAQSKVSSPNFEPSTEDSDVDIQVALGAIGHRAHTRVRTASDPAVEGLQRNLNNLGITDADRRSLDVDGDRGGPRSSTNEAIANFQQEFGLEGMQLGNAELLTATQAALSANPYRRFGQETQIVSPEMLSQPQALGSFAPDPVVAASTAPLIAPRLGGSGRTRGTGDDDERQRNIDADRAPNNAVPASTSADQAMPVIPNPVQTRGPRDPRDPDDPNHAMNQSVREQVKALYAEHGATPTEQQLDQLTAGVMRDAKRSGMDRVNLIEFSVDPRTDQPNLNGKLIAYSGDPDDLVRTRWSATDTQQAQQTAPERAYQDMDQAMQQRSQQQAQFEQQQRDLNQNPDGPTMQR